MENLPKDVKRKLALELQPADLITFCATNRKMNGDICESKEFWRLKLERDYPETIPYFRKYGKTLVNPKATYIRKFTEISKPIDDFVKEYPENWRRRLYNDIYDAYERNKDRLHEVDIGDSFNSYYTEVYAKRDFKSAVIALIIKLVKLYNTYKV
jgi:hypothetical protein